jgi:hypothetical protein
LRKGSSDMATIRPSAATKVNRSDLRYSARNQPHLLDPCRRGRRRLHDAAGGTVGGQIGYRWQQGPLVFGVEARATGLTFPSTN